MHAPSPGPAIFWAAFGAYIALELWVALRDRLAGVDDSIDVGVRQITLSFVGASLLAVLAASTLHGLQLDGWAPVVIGVPIILAGIALRLWAILTLGRFFRRVVEIQEGHRVITTGPYRYVRHPSYTGALLSMIGIGIGLGNVAALLICLIIPGLGYLARIPKEERTLEQALGQEYRDYQVRTRRLIPGIW